MNKPEETEDLKREGEQWDKVVGKLEGVKGSSEQTNRLSQAIR